MNNLSIHDKKKNFNIFFKNLFLIEKMKKFNKIKKKKFPYLAFK